MKLDRYYEARNIIKDVLEKDLYGPLEEKEVIDDFPVSYYVCGKLYPQYCLYDIERASSEDSGEIEEDFLLDGGYLPSTMGMTFSLHSGNHVIRISAQAARYAALEKDESHNRYLWRRKKILLPEQAIDIDSLCETGVREEIEVDEGLKISILVHKRSLAGDKTVTVILINTFKQGERDRRFWVNHHVYFQPKIIVSGKAASFMDVRSNVRLNKHRDAVEMEMLYSDYKNFVTGHGCAVRHSVKDDDILLETDFLPAYESFQMMPAIYKNDELLSVKYLATASRDVMIDQLYKWVGDYQNWIDQQEEASSNLASEYEDVAKDNIRRCKEVYSVIRKSINCLNDNAVYKAFRYANEAMLLQRKRVLEFSNHRFNESDIKWYPFQLAFFLKEIVSFAEPDSVERDMVDLLWFPTGGGKTEAYLGIAAFAIFLRRLSHPENGSGVSVIMRYTLRLLTFQQFERASAMICACELLRKKYAIPGGEISIGLWAGKALTPNKIEMARKILEGFPDPDNESSNPRQLEKCPWCGEPLDQENYSCSTAQKRMLICCGNPNCDFRKGLPVYLIDEEIYTYRPTFLVATIDKFAQVALEEQTFSLFGKNTKNKPPELIIQDELHLISGPLGTITGLYEAAFQKMCTYKGIRAKTIASTATIKNAAEQVRALYGENLTLFPPQAISADDSFFAVRSTAEERPSRMYAGCMGTGMSSTSVMVRVMAATLYATRYLESLGYDEDVIDSFWTITNYFNTLRELGGAIIRVVDNVQDRFAYLRDTKLKKAFPIKGGQIRYDRYIELTSREKSENIGRIIQRDLQTRYTKEKIAMPYDFILSSNMISVGIDIARLNIMLVVGQPKTTAEYIQATSRVGRETPGFVMTMYNQLRSRDKSHFEQFFQYHEAFYKHVEATSVTPFAERARDRALQALFIMLCRFYIDDLSGNHCAGKFHRDYAELKEIRGYILNYVREVDPDEYDNVREELQEIETEWEALAKEFPEMDYRKDRYRDKPALFRDDYEEDSRFRILNSMRSVETTVQVITRE